METHIIILLLVGSILAVLGILFLIGRYYRPKISNDPGEKKSADAKENENKKDDGAEEENTPVEGEENTPANNNGEKTESNAEIQEIKKRMTNLPQGARGKFLNTPTNITELSDSEKIKLKPLAESISAMRNATPDKPDTLIKSSQDGTYKFVDKKKLVGLKQSKGLNDDGTWKDSKENLKAEQDLSRRSSLQYAASVQGETSDGPEDKGIRYRAIRERPGSPVVVVSYSSSSSHKNTLITQIWKVTDTNNKATPYATESAFINDKSLDPSVVAKTLQTIGALGERPDNIEKSVSVLEVPFMASYLTMAQ